MSGMARFTRAGSVSQLEPSCEYTLTLINFDLPPTKEFYDVHGKGYTYRRHRHLRMDTSLWSQAIIAWGLNVTRRDLYKIQYLITSLWWEQAEDGSNRPYIDIFPGDDSRERCWNQIYEQIEHLLSLSPPKYPKHAVPRFWRLCAIDALVLRCYEATKSARQKRLWDDTGRLTEEGFRVWGDVVGAVATTGDPRTKTEEQDMRPHEENVLDDYGPNFLGATGDTGFDRPDLVENLL